MGKQLDRRMRMCLDKEWGGVMDQKMGDAPRLWGQGCVLDRGVEVGIHLDED